MKNGITTKEAIEQYLGFLREDVNRRKSDVVRQSGELEKLYKIYNKVETVADFSPKLMLEIKEHINALKNESTGEELACASKERKYQIHRNFIQWLMNNNLVQADILDGIDSIIRQHSGENFGLYVNRNEFAYYIAGEKGPLTKLFFMFLYHTGQAVSKTLGVQWKDIENLEASNENGDMYISINKAFTRKDGLVSLTNGEAPVRIYIDDELKTEILKFREMLTNTIGAIRDEHFLFSYDGPMNKKFFRSSQRAHEYLRDRVHVPKLRTLDFRNSYIVNMLLEDSSTETLTMIKETLGYSNVNTIFDIYSKLKP